MTTTARAQMCIATKANGEPCGAYAVTGSVFCMSHDPSRAARMAQARSAGGRARHGRKVGTPGTSEPVHLAELADVLVLLERVAVDLYGLENSVSRGRALVSVAAAFIDGYKVTELEKRLTAIESRLDNGNT